MESRSDEVTGFSGNAIITTFRRNVGDYWESPDRRIKIEIVDIKKMDVASAGEEFVQLYVSTGGGIVYGGEKTIKLSVNTYLVPVFRHTGIQGESFMYCYIVDETMGFSFLSTHIKHINFHGRAVTITVCVARAHDRDAAAGMGRK
jgi:hypothetical protein